MPARGTVDTYLHRVKIILVILIYMEVLQSFLYLRMNPKLAAKINA
jgi:hypothetical protein